VRYFTPLFVIILTIMAYSYENPEFKFRLRKVFIAVSHNQNYNKYRLKISHFASNESV